MYWGGYEIIIAKGLLFVNTKDSQICQKHLRVFVHYSQRITSAYKNPPTIDLEP